MYDFWHFSGTKRTVRNREVQYLYGEVRLYVHFIEHPYKGPFSINI